jgi:cytochrome c oxidase subunit 4
MTAPDVTTSPQPTGDEPHDLLGVDAHAGPTDKQYVIVAIILAAITCVEVSTYFSSVIDWGPILMPGLLVMATIKFYLIAAYFMHLKYDRRVLRRMFTAGIVLAVGVYMVVLLAFQLFNDGVPH